MSPANHGAAPTERFPPAPDPFQTANHRPPVRPSSLDCKPTLNLLSFFGYKRGTGRSSGVAFLRKALDLTFFPELFDVRTEIGA